MRILIAATLLLASASHAETPAAAPNWMAGAWAESRDGRWTEEYWTPERGGVMLGAGRSGKGDKLGSWEQTRIERGADGKWIFWGAPDGSKPTPFTMISSNKTEIVFANPEHDYPQRIRYWREGKLLKAEISLADGSNATQWSYKPLGGK